MTIGIRIGAGVFGLALAVPCWADEPIFLGSAAKGPIRAEDRGGDYKANHPLQSGVPMTVSLPPRTGALAADQYTIQLASGSESLLVELAAADVARDFDLYVRFGQPVAVEGQRVVADASSTSYLGFEEVGVWAPALRTGTYYIAIGTYSDLGGSATLTATVNGAVGSLFSGIEVAIKLPSDNSEPADNSVSPDGSQFRFRVPSGAASLYIRFQATDLAWKVLLAARYGQPCAFNPDLLVDYVFQQAGGFIELCLTGADIQPGQNLYLWLLNDAGLNAIVTGRLTIAADRCTIPIAFGETIRDVARGPVSSGAVLGARQFVIDPPDPSFELEITVAPEGVAADLDFFIRKGTPVAMENGQVAADFSAVATGIGPERFVIGCSQQTASEYFLAIGNTSAKPIPYALQVVARPCSIRFRRGDVNADTAVNIADAVTLLQRLFGGGGALKCDDAADGNDDGSVDIGDAVRILSHLFARTGPLKPPFGTPGLDPSPDNLGCRCYPPVPCP